MLLTMVILKTPIKESLSSPLEEYFCENNCPTWGIEKINDRTPSELFGYFDSAEDAQREYAILRGAFPELPEGAPVSPVNDCDWKNEYKKFLTAWNFENLHWVPVWMKDSYKVPEGHKVLYFDAGLAFGTGDHPTTRLCAMSMMDYLKERKGDVANVSLIDAGCGSGILALSAKLLGFGDIYGFDRDEEAVRVSIENAAFNAIALDGVKFEHAGIESALSERKADIVLANIISDVLCIYADNLINSVNSGGRLVLSGILAEENPKVREFFLKRGGDKIASCESAVMGDWSRLEMKIK